MFKAVNSPKNRLQFYKSKVEFYLSEIEDQKTLQQIQEMLQINILGKDTNNWVKLATFLEQKCGDFSSKKPVDIYMNLFCMVQLSHTSYWLDPMQRDLSQYDVQQAASAHRCYYMELQSGQLNSFVSDYKVNSRLDLLYPIAPENLNHQNYSKKISDFPIMELEKFFRDVIEHDVKALTPVSSFN